jgi:hypothetical protein
MLLAPLVNLLFVVYHCDILKASFQAEENIDQMMALTDII